MTSRERFLAACRSQAVDRPPVWLMRQAGRYLPEYRDLKGDTPFMELCRDVDRCTEISLQPWRRFGMDAVIFFCDILVALEAMGAPVVIDEGGPRILAPIRRRADVDALHAFDPERETRFVLEILRRLRVTLGADTALVGFAGAPFTVASYAVEGKGDKALPIIKTLMHTEPDVAHALLERIADATARYLGAQIAAGVDAVQLFDTWAGELGPDDYRTFAAPYHTRVFDQLPAQVPRILYVNGAAPHLEAMASSGADVLSVDWRLDLADARRRVPAKALQGNVDPAVLLGPEAAVRSAVRRCIAATGGAAHIVNLGHGVLKATAPERVGAFVAEVTGS